MRSNELFCVWLTIHIWGSVQARGFGVWKVPGTHTWKLDGRGGDWFDILWGAASLRFQEKWFHICCTVDLDFLGISAGRVLNNAPHELINLKTFKQRWFAENIKRCKDWGQNISHNLLAHRTLPKALLAVEFKIGLQVKALNIKMVKWP